MSLLEIGLAVPEILLPAPGIDLSRWAVDSGASLVPGSYRSLR